MNITTLVIFLLLQWTPNGDRRVIERILEGNWQSCYEGGGNNAENTYTERVYEHIVWKGDGYHKVAWEFHMGPRDEFALFKGGHEDHIPHDSPLNLLTGFHYGNSRTGRNWTVPDLGLRINVVEAGGSREECLSYYILVER